ncbi:hypothetical protein BPOR_0063g00090 [Botrytis porri]|uniref:Cytochrome P450 monooxygenase n=1 Tax=Botrytis porri TaxID=87229 RepID=A0A4Z1L1A4_9HELO|nr:hypothetical protein BPOR_0063g00090 [Botrytis porri]
MVAISTLGFAGLLIGLIWRFIIYPAFISPLAKAPNAHWSSPFSPIWILFQRFRCRENRTVHALHKQLGPLIRLGPNELSTNDVEGIRTVYGGGFEKGEWYSFFDNFGIPCMFSTLPSKNHSSRKRMISNTYSKSTLLSSPALAEQARVILYERLLPTISNLASSSSPHGVDVYDLFNGTTMDFVSSYLFGLKNSANFIKDVSYRRHWMRLYQGRHRYTFYSQELPRLTRFINTYIYRIVPTFVDSANDELEEWCQHRCEATARFLKEGGTWDTEPGNEPVVYNAMVSGIEKESKMRGADSVLKEETLRFPDRSIYSEMIDHLAAGHETAGITVTYLSWHLSIDPMLQRSLREELLILSPNMLFSPTSTASKTPTIPDRKELDALPILHAVLMETLRLRAAIPGGLPRVTPYPSCDIGAYKNIPGGVRIGAQAHSVHRNEQVFSEPERFDYMRWMEGNGMTEEQKRERDRTFWAFSSGGRMCIGSNFAMLEIKLIIAAIYTNFRTLVINDDGVDQMDGYTCGPSAGKLHLRFELVLAPSAVEN